MLGEDQWAWLEEQLRTPAEVRLIASSIQVVAEDHGWEKWMNFPHERERLYRLIRETRAEGVVFLSGDRHLAELSMMDGGGGLPALRPDLQRPEPGGEGVAAAGGEPAPGRHDELGRQLRPDHRSTGTAPTPGSRSRSAIRTARSSSPRSSTSARSAGGRRGARDELWADSPAELPGPVARRPCSDSPRGEPSRQRRSPGRACRDRARVRRMARELGTE